MTTSEIKTIYRPRGFCFWRPKQKYAEGRMINGEKEGKWIFRYQNGQTQMEGEYLAGKKNGKWIKWNENGTIQIEGEFINGKMHGKWTCWYSSGQKQMEGSRVYGKKDGRWRYWEESPDSASPVTEKVDVHDYKTEKEHEDIMRTDLELNKMISQRFREIRQRDWEHMVGRSIGRLIKRWHVLCFIMVLIPAYVLIKPHYGGKALPLAMGSALFATLLLHLFRQGDGGSEK